MEQTSFIAILEGLKMYEQSVRRMQNAKPRFAQIYDEELTNIHKARDEIKKLELDQKTDAKK